MVQPYFKNEIKEKKIWIDLTSIRYNKVTTKEFDFEITWYMILVSKLNKTMKLVTPMMSTKICSGVTMVKFFFSEHLWNTSFNHNFIMYLNWKYFSEKNFWPWKTKNLIQWNTFWKKPCQAPLILFSFYCVIQKKLFVKTEIENRS